MNEEDVSAVDDRNVVMATFSSFIVGFISNINLSSRVWNLVLVKLMQKALI